MKKLILQLLGWAACANISYAGLFDDAKFGDKFKTWVDDKAYEHSKQLVKADLPVRWHRTFVEVYERNSRELEEASESLATFYEKLKDSTPASSRELNLEILIEDFSEWETRVLELRQVRRKLSGVSKALEEIEESDGYDIAYAAGLVGVSKHNVLESVLPIGHSGSIDLRGSYSISFTYTWSYGEGGDASDGEGSVNAQYSGSFVGFLHAILESLPIVNMGYYYAKNDVEREQMEVFHNAVRRFNEVSLDASEVAEISRDNYLEIQTAYESTHDSQRVSLQMLEAVCADALRYCLYEKEINYRRLEPYKRQYNEDKLQIQPEIQRIIDDERAYLRLRKVIGRFGEASALLEEAELEDDEIESALLADESHDILKELEFVIHDLRSLPASFIYSDWIERYEQRIKGALDEHPYAQSEI
ncbi:hypothetical protein [Cerasicoccus frondis]|uniref:hypothetical protein n=1 Tax=Cerasicoccus frondis TaxID=490090 RepID=UPI002852D36E|nr:hypothetical protein [Cerasicoccus frondis]